MAAPQIDPNTGEPIQASGGAPQIDPNTGECINRDEGEVLPPDTRNSVQKYMDNLAAPTYAPPDESLGHHLIRGVANFGGGVIGGLTSPLVHPVQTAQSVGHLVSAAMGNPTDMVNDFAPMVQSFKEHPEETIESGLGNIGGGLLLAHGIGKVAPRVVGLIPTRARAGELFQSVASDAANQPVSLTRSLPFLQKMSQLGKEGGGPVPLPARQLLTASGEGTPRSVPLLRGMQDELNGVGSAAPPKPLLYPSARNFQSGLSSMSREEAGRLSGPMGGQLKQLNKALYDDIHDSLGETGRADDYVKAMRDFRHAAQLNDAFQTAKKWAIPAAVGTGAAGTLIRAMTK